MRDLEAMYLEHLAFVRANLALLGVEDPEVMIAFRVTDQRHKQPDRMITFDLSLSEALHHEVCCAWRSFFAPRWPEETTYKPEVQMNGELFGYLDSSGFRYKDPPSLRLALAWMIVARWENPPFLFDLDKAVSVLAAVVAEGVTEEIFVMKWLPALKHVFALQPGMTVRDGYRSSEVYLWRVATKDVYGESHPGYPGRVEPCYLLRVL
ncbi:MAG: hypothetical protein NTX72_01210 [Candidatus Uhrbacteria bacterium]|nr:hypothetical protein [Candidatus Uhrbacteria bacterium]